VVFSTGPTESDEYDFDEGMCEEEVVVGWRGW
jgi:hypothetical protein